MIPYEYAKILVTSQKIQSQEGYRAWVKKEKLQEFLPANPSKVYKEKWQSWSAFLDALDEKEFEKECEKSLRKKLQELGKEHFRKKKRGRYFVL